MCACKLMFHRQVQEMKVSLLKKIITLTFISFLLVGEGNFLEYLQIRALSQVKIKNKNSRLFIVHEIYGRE